jgi:hypothetical protein
MVFFFIAHLLSNCKQTRMLTGLDVQMIDDPQVHIVCFSGLTWCLGAYANNQPYLGPQLKPNIRLLLILPQNSSRFVLFFKNLGFGYLLHQHFGAIILGLPTCRSIRFFMPVPSMWKLISTFFVIVLMINTWTSASFLVRIKWLMCLLSHLSPLRFNSCVSSSTCVPSR